MRSLRSYRLTPTLLVVSLALMAAAPLAQACCAMPDRVAEQPMPEMPCHDTDSAPDEAPVPTPTAAMPCCTPAAVAARAPATPALDVVLVLPSIALVPQTHRPLPAPDFAPPDRPVPLHIALGRFLT